MSREQNVTVMPDPNKSVRRNFFGLKSVFVIFTVIIALLLFFAYSGSMSITGNVVSNIPFLGGNKTIDTEGHFSFEANVGELDKKIELKQEIEEISLILKGTGNVIHLGKDNILDLSELNTAKIELQDFEGTIVFDSEKILELKGLASTIKVNGIPSTKVEGKIAIEMPMEAEYQSLSLSEIYLKKYTYTGTGKIELQDGKISLNMEEETLYMQGFLGSIDSGLIEKEGTARTGLDLKGTAKEVDVGEEFSLKASK